jgi:N-acetylmuramoyl-L-alanine amidase
MRCQVSSGRHVWILKEDLLVTDSRSIVPSSVVRTINVVDGPNGVRLVIPLTQRLPYQIEQQLRPNRLTLRIFGVTADTDWITQSPPEVNNDLLDHVTWKQASDQVYEVTAHLALDRQWGFSADYEDTNLVLQIKAPPRLAPGGGALNGLRICVDPGHGGDETGALGPSGIRESEVNLAMALKLKDHLQREGATVIMTRSTETEGPTLAQRVETAVKQRCDLLLSVHNNALPDGRDPWAEHGTSSYWYHPQSIELAKTLKAALVKELGFPDFGTLYQNLALVRPSQMPAVLVEVGFMINPDEYAQLIDPQVQKRAARALVNGIRSYLGVDRHQE